MEVYGTKCNTDLLQAMLNEFGSKRGEKWRATISRMFEEKDAAYKHMERLNDILVDASRRANVARRRETVLNQTTTSEGYTRETQEEWRRNMLREIQHESEQRQHWVRDNERQNEYPSDLENHCPLHGQAERKRIRYENDPQAAKDAEARLERLRQMY